MKGAIVVLLVTTAAGFAPVRADEAGAPDDPRSSWNGVQAGYKLAGNGTFGDNAPSLEPGVRVRVSTTPQASRPDRIVGTVITVTSDRLTIRPQQNNGREIEVACTAVTHLEVSRGQHSRWLTGLGIGFLAGAAIGYADLHDGHDLAPEHAALAGAVPGALVGALIGALFKAERWQGIPVALGVMGGAQTSGYAVRVTVPLGFRTQ